MIMEMSDDEPYLVGERRLSIKLKNRNANVITPMPAVTNSDFTAANILTKKYNTDIYYPNTMFEDQDVIYRAHLGSRILDEDGRDRHSETINSNISNAKSFSDSVLSYYVPFLDKETYVTKSLVESLVKMQLNTDLDFVTILDSIRILPDDMKSLTTKISREIIDNGKEPLYMVRMDMDTKLFRSRIERVRELVSGVIGLYSDIRLHYSNYDFISSLRSDSGLFRVISGFSRVFPEHGFGGFFPLGFLTADVFSPILIKPGNNKHKKKTTPTELRRKKRIVNERRNARRFDDSTGGYLTIPLHKHIHGQTLDCICPICYNSEVDDLLAEYEGDLKKAFRVHDVFGIFNFTIRSSGLFHNGTLQSDLESRLYSKQVLQETFLARGLKAQSTLRY